MYNWSTDTTLLAQNPAAYERFTLEQQINFGLNGEKVSLEALIRHWDTLVIDENRRRFLKKLVWPKS
jgi:hypothetical protein